MLYNPIKMAIEILIEFIKANLSLKFKYIDYFMRFQNTFVLNLLEIKY